MADLVLLRRRRRLRSESPLDGRFGFGDSQIALTSDSLTVVVAILARPISPY